MATSLVASWRFTTTDVDWDATYAGIKAIMVSTFATAALPRPAADPLRDGPRGARGVRRGRRGPALRARTSTTSSTTCDRFGIENDGEVFHADDRPYGLIQAAVTRDDAPDAGPAWDAYTGLV